MLRLKLALGGIIALLLLALTHPAGTRTAVTGTVYGLGSLLGLAAAAGISWAAARVCRHRQHRRACALPAPAGRSSPANCRPGAGN